MLEHAEKRRWPRWKKLLVGVAAAAGYLVLFGIAVFYIVFYLIEEKRDKALCYSPLNYPGSTWVCEEEDIWFTVGEDWKCTGEAVVNGETVEICLTMPPVALVIETMDEETNQQRSLWVGQAEFERDKLVLNSPYRNLLTHEDGPLVFERQANEKQDG